MQMKFGESRMGALFSAKIFQRTEGGIISKDGSLPGENVINNERVTGGWLRLGPLSGATAPKLTRDA